MKKLKKTTKNKVVKPKKVSWTPKGSLMGSISLIESDGNVMWVEYPNIKNHYKKGHRLFNNEKHTIFMKQMKSGKV